MDQIQVGACGASDAVHRATCTITALGHITITGYIKVRSITTAGVFNYSGGCKGHISSGRTHQVRRQQQVFSWVLRVVVCRPRDEPFNLLRGSITWSCVM